ncbi:hypothetical protein [Staphylococcus shinii]|uniref:hypothetical protein n=1 Tax=Staphylococcus shinii TaxID=2912228 RepID=UPI003F57F133
MSYEEAVKVIRELEQENEKLKSENYVLEKNFKAMENLWKKSMDREGQLKECIKNIEVIEYERDKLEEENKHLKERINKAEELIEGNIETLKMHKGIISKNYELEKENKALRLQSNTYFEQWQEAKKELQNYQDDYEMVTGNCIYWEDKAHWLEDEYGKSNKQYTTLTDHIRLKAENNPSVSRYIDLVNYIDRLERD